MEALFPPRKRCVQAWFPCRAERNAEEWPGTVRVDRVDVDVGRTVVGPTMVLLSWALIGGPLCVALPSSSVDSAALLVRRKRHASLFAGSPTIHPSIHPASHPSIYPSIQPATHPLARPALSTHGWQGSAGASTPGLPVRILMQGFSRLALPADLLLSALPSQLLLLSGLLTHRPGGELQMAPPAGPPSHTPGCTHV